MSPRVFVATRKGLFTFERSGSASQPWKIAQTAFLGDNCPMFLHDRRDGALYAALNHGHFGNKLHRSTDGGKSWTEIGVPAYPERPADYPDETNPMSGKPIPWKLELIWSLEAGGPTQNGRLWCGTLPGGLFRSDDLGRNWELVRSLWDHPLRRQWFGGGAELPGIHSIIVDPRNAERVVVGVSCGGVWVTNNDGQTWACQADGMRAEYMPPEQAGTPHIQDAHRVVQCPAMPEVFWAQHHNGIFRTTDDCKSWYEITAAQPSAFGFAVAVHPRDADTAWFVPGIKDEKRIPVDGKVVVSRTRDGGKTFEVLRKGLPQEHAYDLTLRHALDIDTTGTLLAFGSTTGSVWLSEDGGDSWLTLTTHLPPVYCVRIEK